MHPMQRLVLLIFAQSLAFLASWSLAYGFAHRLRRGHWTYSLVIILAIQVSACLLVLPHGSVPGLGWWVPCAVAVIGTIALTENWNALGQACVLSTILLSGLFLAYVVAITRSAHLGPLSLLLALALLALQAFALLLLCAGSWEILDVMCRIRWPRIRRPEPTAGWYPRVSLHVPAYNEPPDMVIETLDALANLDYPNYEVLVIDNNTTDPDLWHPLEEHCRKLGFKFFHLDNWPGFKSGALNFALKNTDPAVEIVGIVDSDYVVQPDYLRSCVGFLRDPSVAFVQTPQDYRDVAAGDRYANACYHAYLYFFKISMMSRNEHNGIIFAGTMGLIRRSVLEDLGGWDEWCITEDAELSLRILERGLTGIYIDRSFGRGLMPLNFEGLKKQRFRWAFGGMQIMRRHWEALVPWARWTNPAHRLSFAQQWDYLMGGLQWLNDPVTFSFTLLLLLGAGSLLLAHSLFIQPLAPAVLYVPFLFIFIGVSRFLWALRLRVGCTLSQAATAFIVLLGLTWVVTLACILGLIKKRGVFLRTPKRLAKVDPWHTLRIVRHETTLFLLCGGMAIALASRFPNAPHIWLMTGLLFWQCLIYVSAPVTSYWGYQSELRSLHPELINASRTTGFRFSSMISDRRVTWGVVGAFAAAVLLFSLSVRFAPEQEQAFRANPYRMPLLPEAVMATSPEAQVKAVLYMEKEAAMRGSAADALSLWDSSGVIRDAAYTVADTTDDLLWRGSEGIRQRYAREFAQHRYLDLSHSDASVVIEGDRAVIVNDLHAQIATPSGVQRVFLSRGDRWVLRRTAEGWRIVGLTVNRAPR
jgi:cellulose synthase/poly-beta-1,6-N-acetylglucosamine synthase-like glycosyltransferase